MATEFKMSLKLTIVKLQLFSKIAKTSCSLKSTSAKFLQNLLDYI
jgi:hypothetical protein